MKPEKQTALLTALEAGWLIVEPETGRCWNARKMGRPIGGGGFVRYLLAKKPRPLGQALNGSGYRTVSLHISGKKFTFHVHQIVWLAAKGRIPPGKEIHHINGVKTDNRIANLALVTRAENLRYAREAKRNER